MARPISPENTRLAHQSLDLGAYEFQGQPIKVSFKSVSSELRRCGSQLFPQLLTLSGTNVPLTAFHGR